ncbi:MAG: TetR/AcrR family transcriptional regulator [Eubacterium sp.]|nr:TetR/AcrR family transcriptional regulator [Eubacterium sp.]
MPRRSQYTKEEIARRGLEIVEERGMESLTARELAKSLGTTVAPIFVHYPSMEELKEDVRSLAQGIYHEYLDKGLQQEIPFRGVGLQYIAFAKEKPELYYLLFLGDRGSQSQYAMEEMRRTQDYVRDSLQRVYQLDSFSADCYFRDMWLVAHSIATLLVTGGCNYSDEEIQSIMTEFSLGICKAYKEIDGLAEGNYDCDKEFTKIIRK